MGRSRSSKSSESRYATLEPRIHYVSEAAVKKKWKKLTPSSQQNVQEVIASVKGQLSRSISRPNRKDNDNDAVVDEVVTRLCQRLPRMPFPSTTNDDTFDFELTLNRIQTTEQQLTNNAHSISLLREQIKKEEISLQLDKEEVSQLQDSLKANNTLRRQQYKTLHPLAHRLSNTQYANHNSLSNSIDTRGHSRLSSLSNLFEDPEVATLLHKLGDHLESMENNTASMQKVLMQMHKASCALDTRDFESL